ncbi:hypothetical protein TNCV_422791 [Trichonephila clavipes]|nr:hypothetical protein TNCV_422791 [Trichonephila clavipes]
MWTSFRRPALKPFQPILSQVAKSLAKDYLFEFEMEIQIQMDQIIWLRFEDPSGKKLPSDSQMESSYVKVSGSNPNKSRPLLFLSSRDPQCVWIGREEIYSLRLAPQPPMFSQVAFDLKGID